VTTRGDATPGREAAVRMNDESVFDLSARFGQIDIYLFDQIVRGRVPAGTRVLDAGCGSGRNLVYFLRSGYPVYAADADPDAIDVVRDLASRWAPHLPPTNFRAEPVEAMSFPDRAADFVICSAVLHFARDAAHFRAMLDGAWRVLRPGGVFFSRLASTIGMPDRMRPLGDGRYALPDGSERFLVDEPMLMSLTGALGGRLVDPLKTTVVQNHRCMTTWVVRRQDAA
jgi:tellurite methyltransferase